jgi:hypothetical protein
VGVVHWWQRRRPVSFQRSHPDTPKGTGSLDGNWCLPSWVPDWNKSFSPGLSVLRSSIFFKPDLSNIAPDFSFCVKWQGDHLVASRLTLGQLLPMKEGPLLRVGVHPSPGVPLGKTRKATQFKQALGQHLNSIQRSTENPKRLI